MDEREVFQLADRTLNELVAKIPTEQWTAPLSTKFARRGEGH